MTFYCYLKILMQFFVCFQSYWLLEKNCYAAVFFTSVFVGTIFVSVCFCELSSIIARHAIEKKTIKFLTNFYPQAPTFSPGCNLTGTSARHKPIYNVSPPPKKKTDTPRGIDNFMNF